MATINADRKLQEDDVPGKKRPMSAPLIGPLLDSEMAAAVIGVHAKTLQKWARRGEFPGRMIGGLWRFRKSDLENWIERRFAS